MSKSKKRGAKEAKRLMGRMDWNGVKSFTRVIPNKKRPKPLRKAKHKGRHYDAGPFHLSARVAALREFPPAV